MKKWSRLTALMLAVVIMLSNASGALALVEVDFDMLNTWIQNVKTANGLGGVVQLIRGGEVVYVPESFVPSDWPLYTVVDEVALGSYAPAEAPDLGVVLDQNGKVNLAAPAAGQWQVYFNAADIWVNVSGENGSTFALTFAKVQSLFMENNSAKLRCVMGDTVTQTVNVQLTYAAATLPAAEEPLMYAVQKSAADDGVQLAADDGIYDVTVQYVMATGETAANSWIAEVNPEIDATLKQTITLPEVVGYKPTLKTTGVTGVTFDETARTLTLDMEVAANITIIIEYVADEVIFHVQHYQQNVNDDKYTLALMEELKGETKTIVPVVAKDYEGFYALLYERPEIAADGSTIVEIYYDRNYYLMNFELAGGEGVEPVYARYGASIGTVPTPNRAGYTFAGWVDANGNAVSSIPATMPAANTTYTATWTTGTTSYSVVYWFEKADSTDANDPNNYAYVHGLRVDNVPTESTVTSDSRADITTLGNAVVNSLKEDPKHFTRYTNTDSASGGKLKDTYTIEGDGTTIVNVYYKRNSYTIRFYFMRDTGANRDRYEIPSNYGHYLSNSSWPRSQSSTITPQQTVKAEYQSMLGSATHTIGRNTYTYWYLDLTAKYNSDISALWPADAFNTFNGYKQNSWAIHYDTSYYDDVGNTKTFKGVYSRLDDALIVDTTNDAILNEIRRTKPDVATYFLSYWSTGQEYFDYYIYYEAIPGETIPEDATTRTYNNKTYILQRVVRALSGSGYSGQNAPGYNGVVHVTNGKQQGSGSGNDADHPMQVFFYYQRLNYDLLFMSNGVEVKKETVLFGAQMLKYDFTPTNGPANTQFAGWYTSEACIDGSEYDFTTETMPDNGVILYAKWVPVNRTVKFYLDENALAAGTTLLPSHPTQTVSHGSKLGAVEDPKNGSYNFVGWFYVENGVEKAFDFANMPVTKDMKVYAKWNSDVLKQYFIYFKLQGTDTEVADYITGSKRAGTTLTFEAKGAEELYPDYQKGYFPVVPSHSFTLDITKELQVYTFEYVHMDNVPYVVYYVTKQQNANNSLTQTVELNGETYYILEATKEVKDNNKAIVVETFKQVQGYMPDAYQKKLVLSVDENGYPNTEDNIIVFEYTRDTQHAYYQVTHYIEALDGSWVEYSAPTQSVGDIGTSYTADSIQIDGFTYKETQFEVNNEVVKTTVDTTEKVELTEAGLEINLYYERNSYPYEVRYRLLGTTKDLVSPDEKTALYEQAVTEQALAITNYTPVAPTEQTITIKIEESQTDAKLNIITFYYTEKKNVLNYQVVGPDGCGTVDLYDQDETTVPGAFVSELVDVFSGTAKGATAQASSSQYVFCGWYSTKDCSEDSLITNAAYHRPTKNGENVPWAEATTYYAKFEEKKVNLNYEVVGPTGCGTVDLNDGDATGPAEKTSETVEVISGKPVGATAAASNNTYKFEGWYSNKECTQLITTEASWKPTKAEGASWSDGTTYYAKFEYNLTYLTIKKEGSTVASDDTFVFRIDGDNAEGMQVVIQGTNSVTVYGLTVGEMYTVTEIAHNFRYGAYTVAPANGVITLDADRDKNVVTFTNKVTNNQWLDDDDYQPNAFTGVANQ